MAMSPEDSLVEVCRFTTSSLEKGGPTMMYPPAK
jgi:hypothetical protein